MASPESFSPPVTSKEVALNPKTISAEELFGCVPSGTRDGTRERRDGLLCAIMRNLGGIPDQAPKWIVLDGDVDTDWIESLNSVMDDNRVRQSE